jgi:hypothetical protein
LAAISNPGKLSASDHILVIVSKIRKKTSEMLKSPSQPFFFPAVVFYFTIAAIFYFFKQLSGALFPGAPV